jgi:uncharacterized membrane protein (DUF485 family)
VRFNLAHKPSVRVKGFDQSDKTKLVFLLVGNSNKVVKSLELPFETLLLSNVNDIFLDSIVSKRDSWRIFLAVNHLVVFFAFVFFFGFVKFFLTVVKSSPAWIVISSGPNFLEILFVLRFGSISIFLNHLPILGPSDVTYVNRKSCDTVQ